MILYFDRLKREGCASSCEFIIHREFFVVHLFVFRIFPKTCDDQFYPFNTCIFKSAITFERRKVISEATEIEEMQLIEIESV